MEGHSIRRGTVLGLLGLIALFSIPSVSSAAGIPGRPDDPVVLTGSQLPTLAGTGPGKVVAFRWSGKKWVQVAVQVDERTQVPYKQIYNNTPNCQFSCTYAGLASVYADAGTFVGADANANLDADDEVALMAKDSGDKAGSAAYPKGVVARSAVDLSLTDPISKSKGHHIYLFRSSGRLNPSAGQSYVNYNFSLNSGAYKTTYDHVDGPNPENSTVATDYYGHRLTDRWGDNELRIFGNGATGVDILDTDKVQFAPNTCGRSETTFQNGEGAFVINKSGPVRAIRAYMGANSGPYTERDHIYYQRRQDIRTHLRVHPIPSVMSFMDYSPAASGMTYRNPANPGGVTIDGVPETPAASPGGPSWEQVSGPQGTLDIVNDYVTDVAPITLAGYYYDDNTPDGGHQQCSGDAMAYGSSGTYLTSAIPNTDPAGGTAKSLTAIRHMFYDAPSAAASQAALREQQINQPIQVAVLKPKRCKKAKDKKSKGEKPAVAAKKKGKKKCTRKGAGKKKRR